MSKYNKYAVRLDQAFKESREKCLKALDNLKAAQDAFDKSKLDFTERYVGERGVVRARTSALLKEAQENYIAEFKNAWESFKHQRDELACDLFADLIEDYKLNTTEIDKSVVALIETGMCSPNDLNDIAKQFSDNNTMLRYIAKYAERRSSEETTPANQRKEFKAISKNVDPETAMNGIKQKWNTLVSASDRFSTTRKPITGIENHTEYSESMMKHWDDVAANIENF